jgi:predicted transposase YdaD
MHYDIASKILMEKCRGQILRRLFGLSVAESSLLQELPQETVSVKRSDFAVMVTDESGAHHLVLLEIQTRWDRQLPLRLLDYRSRYLLKYDVDAISCILLLRPSGAALARYEDSEVTFAYRLIRLYEMDAREIVEENILCLMPFVPIMQHGEDLLDQADSLLYQSALSREDKADMLTVMTIFSGLISDKLPRMLVAKRRDIMIESAAYDVIKQEGLSEGLQQGLSEGLQQGLQQGKVQEAQEAILDNLEARFEIVPESIAKEVQGIEELGVLKALHRRSVKVATLDEFKALLKKAKA